MQFFWGQHRISIKKRFREHYSVVIVEKCWSWCHFQNSLRKHPLYSPVFTESCWSIRTSLRSRAFASRSSISRRFFSTSDTTEATYDSISVRSPLSPAGQLLFTHKRGRNLLTYQPTIDRWHWSWLWDLRRALLLSDSPRRHQTLLLEVSLRFCAISSWTLSSS